MKIISFSLWGNEKKYRIGAIENCKLAKKIYPEWKPRFYIDKSIEIEFANDLHQLGAEILQITDNRGPFYGMYWRFFVNDDPTVKRYIIRDCDSRLNWRERAAVDEWCQQDTGFHIMRDHKNHNHPIQGGMWGGKTGIIPNIQILISQWNQYHYYNCDQLFLANIIYPVIKRNATVHDEFYEKKPFPLHRQIEDGGWFVGQIYNAQGIAQKD